MLPSDYLEIMAQQLRCGKARELVTEEIRAHINDQTKEYIKEGMSPEEAEEKSVAQMGDPVEAGIALDRIHRPRVDWRAIGMSVFLSAAGILLQWIACRESSASVEIISFLKYTLIGLVVMIGISLLDYTIIGKYPRTCFALYGLAAVLYGQISSDWYLSGMAWFMIPLFAGIVYYYRNKGYGGIAKSLIWIFAGGYILIAFGKSGLSECIMVIAAEIMILSFGVIKGWNKVSAKMAGVLLGGSILVPLATVFYYLFFGAGYQSQRILAFLTPNEYKDGIGYRMREVLNSLHIAGTGTFNADKILQGTENQYFFLWLMNKFGVAAGMLLLVILGCLFVRMLKIVLQQKNRLGSLVGIGCVCGIFLPAAVHVLVNITLLPPTIAALPFFSNGKEIIVLYYAVIGLYLSVYRNSSIVKEPSLKGLKKKTISGQDMI